MAKVKTNPILQGISGKIGDDIIIKQYGKKQVLSRSPDMSKVKPSKGQKKQRSRFQMAVAYAKMVNNNPALRADYAKNLSGRSNV